MTFADKVNSVEWNFAVTPMQEKQFPKRTNFKRLYDEDSVMYNKSLL